jgi:GH15 family glucan-1,4-alpha-glucosidase
LSEDVDPISGSQWGNCPQTYSHVGVINAAFDIWKKLDRPAFLEGVARF